MAQLHAVRLAAVNLIAWTEGALPLPRDARRKLTLLRSGVHYASHDHGDCAFRPRSPWEDFSQEGS